MTYLTYEEYAQLGGEVEQSAFPRFQREAKRKLDFFTQGRIKKLDVIPDEVKECMAEFINTMAGQQGEKVASFSNGSVSVSFEQNQKSDDAILFDIAEQYLPISLISLVVDL